MRIFYTLLFYLIQPLVLLRLLWRSRKAPAYRERMAERYGFYKDLVAPAPCIWIHAVSVGETIACVPLVKALAQSHPELALVVTTTTPTGSERVHTLLGDLVHHVYAPYDLPFAVKRFLRTFEPRLLIIMETELWPNMIHQCRVAGVPVLLANARLSAKSAAGYRRVAALVRPMLEELDRVAVQTEIEAARFTALGLSPSRLVVTGNIKFDMTLSREEQQRARRWRQLWGASRAIWIAASTHEGEDEIVLRCQRELLGHFPELLLILVPRHPERFDAVAQLCREERFTLARLSEGEEIPRSSNVLLGDTMGDLPALYGTADIAFVAGSLVARGGHNLLEPALWSLPVLSGPHIFNFQEIAELMEQAGGLQFTADALQLEGAIRHLLTDGDYRFRMGQSAFGVVERNRGALDRLVAVTEELLAS